MVDDITKKIKSDYKNLVTINTKDYLKKKKIRKDNMPETDIVTCLKKTNEN